MSTSSAPRQEGIDTGTVLFGIIFFIALFVLFRHYAFKSDAPLQKRKPEQVTPSARKPNIQANLPIRCRYVSSQATLSAQLNGSVITFVSDTPREKQNAVIQDDCAYTWIEGERIGLKQCGMKTMVQLGRQLLSSGLISFEQIAAGMGQVGVVLPYGSDKLFQSCKNVRSEDLIPLTVPKTVRFEEQTKPTP